VVVASWGAAIGALTILLSGAVGNGLGRLAASTRQDFDVLGRNPLAGTVEVVFIDGDRYVTRSLKLASDSAEGQRHHWVPGVTIRPLPEAGLEYETDRLGRTHRTRP
jgi:hypothetical protein